MKKPPDPPPFLSLYRCSVSIPRFAHPWTSIPHHSDFCHSHMPVVACRLTDRLFLCRPVPIQALLKIGTKLKGGVRSPHSKGRVQPCELMADFFVADRVRIRPHRSYAYGPHVTRLCLLSFEFSTVLSLPLHPSIVPRISASEFWDLQLQTKTLKFKNDSVSLRLPHNKCPLFKALRKVSNLSLMNWVRFVMFVWWLPLILWPLGLSTAEFVASFLCPYFAQNVCDLIIFVASVYDFWVEAYTLSRGCEDLVGFYWAWTVSIWCWVLLSRFQLCTVPCYPASIDFAVYPLPLCFLRICCQIRWTDLLDILLSASLGEDVVLQVIFCLYCLASRVMRILIIAHVLDCEFNNLSSASISSWGFATRFSNHRLVAASSLHGWFINFSNYLLLHYSSYLHFNKWYMMSLLFECSSDLLMARGHKVYPLRPKANS